MEHLVILQALAHRLADLLHDAGAAEAVPDGRRAVLQVTLAAGQEDGAGGGGNILMMNACCIF